MKAMPYGLPHQVAIAPPGTGFGTSIGGAPAVTFLTIACVDRSITAIECGPSPPVPRNSRRAPTPTNVG